MLVPRCFTFALLSFAVVPSVVECIPRFLLIKSCGSETHDQGFNEMAFEAAEEFAQAGKINYEIKGCMDLTSFASYHEENPDLEHVVGIGFDAVSTIDPLLSEYPKLKFSTIDATTSEMPENVQAALFSEDSGSFVVGVLAGLATKTKVVGGVFGVPAAPLVRFRNGFIAGVQHICPTCTILTDYVFSFADLVAGGRVTDFYISEMNADVIFAAAGGTGIGALLHGSSQDVFVIGVDTDQFYTVFQGNSSLILTSMMKSVDVTVRRIVQDHLDGTFLGGQVMLMDFSNDGIRLAECHSSCDKLNSTAWAEVESARSRIASGALSSGVDTTTNAISMNNFFANDLPGNSWTPIRTFGSSPAKVHEMAYSTVSDWSGGITFFFGGDEATTSSRLWKFSHNSKSWDLLLEGLLLLGEGANLTANYAGEFPPARSQATLTTLGDGATMVLFGGLDKSSRLNDLWALTQPIPFVNIFTTWSKIIASGTLPSARFGHAAASPTLKDGESKMYLYVFGGRDNTDATLNDLWQLEIELTNFGSSKWRQICAQCTPLARSEHTLTYYDGYLYVHGGYDSARKVLMDTWRYEIDSGSWTALQSAPIARARHTAEILMIKPPSKEIQPAIAVTGGAMLDSTPDRARIQVMYFLLDSQTWTVVDSEYDETTCRCSSDTADFGNPVKPIQRMGQGALVLTSTDANTPDKMMVFGGTDIDGNLLLDSYVFHPSANDVVEDKSYDTSVNMLALLLCGFSVIIAFFLIVWTFYFSNHNIVKVSQTPFLALIAVGGMISSLSIIPMTIDDSDDTEGKSISGDYEHANAACMAQVWLFTGGFCIMFGPAFAKMHRVVKVFNGGKSLKRVRISNGQLVSTILAVLLIDWCAVAAWSIVSPLRYYRVGVEFDKFGNTIKSVGVCQSEMSKYFIWGIFSFHIIVLLFGNYVSYHARNLSTHFSESKYLQLALVSQFELMAITTPVLVMVYETPTSRLFLMSGVVFLNTISTLLLIFVPKILSVWRNESIVYTQNSTPTHATAAVTTSLTLSQK